MRLAVIPARGGSKRIPRKNIKNFFGKPIIAWSIDVAIQSGCFDRVVVSTDDEEIANISRSHGAEVPFSRPSELSGDKATTIPVIAHAIEWFKSEKLELSSVCCIYPTAPLLRPADLLRGFNMLVETGSDYAFSVCAYDYPIQRALRITGDNKVEMFSSEYIDARSQDIEKAYHDAGQFYWGTTEAWLEQRPIFSKNSTAIVLPSYLVQDIDTEDDWIAAELKYLNLSRL